MFRIGYFGVCSLHGDIAKCSASRTVEEVFNQVLGFANILDAPPAESQDKCIEESRQAADLGIAIQHMITYAAPLAAGVFFFFVLLALLHYRYRHWRYWSQTLLCKNGSEYTREKRRSRLRHFWKAFWIPLVTTILLFMACCVSVWQVTNTVVSVYEELESAVTIRVGYRLLLMQAAIVGLLFLFFPASLYYLSDRRLEKVYLERAIDKKKKDDLAIDALRKARGYPGIGDYDPRGNGTGASVERRTSHASGAKEREYERKKEFRRKPTPQVIDLSKTPMSQCNHAR